MDFYVFFTLILYLRVYLLNLKLHWLEGSISKDACQKTVSGLIEQFRFSRFYVELPNFGPSPQLIQIQRMKELHLKISFLGFLLLVHSFITFSLSYFNFYCYHQLRSHQNFLQVCGHRQILYLTYKHQQTIFSGDFCGYFLKYFQSSKNCMLTTLIQLQENAKILQERSIAYINSDSSIEGASYFILKCDVQKVNSIFSNFVSSQYAILLLVLTFYFLS